MISKELNEREALILRQIIERYVQWMQPVASRELSKHTPIGLSAASIRN